MYARWSVQRQSAGSAAHPRQVHGRLLVDPDAVAHDAQAPVLVDAAAGDHLPLALAVEIHNAEVHNRAQPCEGLDNLKVGAPAVGLRVQADELRIAALTPDEDDATVEVGDRAGDAGLT